MLSFGTREVETCHIHVWPEREALVGGHGIPCGRVTLSSSRLIPLNQERKKRNRPVWLSW